MSILRLQKISLCGLVSDREPLLDALQALGCLHLIALRQPDEQAQDDSEGGEGTSDTLLALQYLLDTPEKRHPLRESRVFDLDKIVTEVLEVRQRRRDLEDRLDALSHRMRDLHPWGNFHLPPADDLAGRRLWFYAVPLGHMKRLDDLSLPWQEVHRDNRFAYVVVISADEPPHDALPVARTHTGALSLEALERQHYHLEMELEELAARRQSLTRWIHLLARNLSHAEDAAALKHASARTLERGQLFLVQGWATERDMPAIEQLAQRQGLVMMHEPPEADEQPPTLMENPPLYSGGQDLVSFYRTPAYDSWDPSLLVFVSFALFFAMILADAGYALVLALVVGRYWKRMGQSAAGVRFRTLSLSVLSVSLLYGVLVGSYFGFGPPDGVLSALAIIDLQNYDAMMRLAIGVGCLHLIIANGITAWRAPTQPARITAGSWIVAILGGLMLWLGPAWLGVPLLAGGVFGIGYAASDRPCDHWKSTLLRVLEGLGALTNITKLFGDILSYLRLFALGLASASLAVTFNDLASQVQEAVPGMGLFLGLLIMLLGHAINLALGIISGFVHGLRLNFIEFFNWGLSEEGYPFRAFAKKAPLSGSD